MFRLALDFDGVVTRHPDHLRFLADRILMSGGAVYILTARMEKEREFTLRQLRMLHFRFTKLICCPFDYELQHGNYVTEDDLSRIGQWKTEMCRKFEVDLFADDSLHQYNTVFDCPTIFI